jgi:hypothetical protein
MAQLIDANRLRDKSHDTAEPLADIAANLFLDLLLNHLVEVCAHLLSAVSLETARQCR